MNATQSDAMRQRDWAGELAEIHAQLQERKVMHAQRESDLVPARKLAANLLAAHIMETTGSAGKEPARFPWIRVTLLIIVTSLLILSGCGGGGAEDVLEDGFVKTPRVNCAAQPELCK